MDNDEAYDMGYTDGHQDGERDAWLIATPIIHKLRTALRMLYDEMDEYQRINKLSAYNNQVMRQARAALEEK